MTDTSTRVTWGVLGVIVGFLVGGGAFFRSALQPAGLMPHWFGVPELFILMFVTFWIVIIALAVRWLFIGRDRRPDRLADLPADFDDWHRRAHAQMDREAAARAGGTQP